MPTDEFLERHYDDPVAMKELLMLQLAEEGIVQMAVQAAVATIKRDAQQRNEDVLTDLNVPLGGQPGGEEGGAAPGAATRVERPAVPEAGLGGPVVPPPQAQGGVPPGQPAAVGVV
jgi:hypothetical protein